MKASVYLAYKGDKLLYVGITGTGTKRLSQHRRNSEWWLKADRIELEHYPTRSRAMAREADLIEERKPRFNKKPGHRRCREDLMSLDELYAGMSVWPKERLLKWAEKGKLPVADWIEGAPLFDEEEILSWVRGEAS